MTTDKEFPSEVLKLLYHMIGELCVRGRSLNLAALVIRDTTEIFTEQMELYRRVCKRCAGTGAPCQIFNKASPSFPSAPFAPLLAA